MLLRYYYYYYYYYYIGRDLKKGWCAYSEFIRLMMMMIIIIIILAGILRRVGARTVNSSGS